MALQYSIRTLVHFALLSLLTFGCNSATPTSPTPHKPIPPLDLVPTEPHERFIWELHETLRTKTGTGPILLGETLEQAYLAVPEDIRQKIDKAQEFKRTEKAFDLILKSPDLVAAPPFKDIPNLRFFEDGGQKFLEVKRNEKRHPSGTVSPNNSFQSK